MLAAGCSDFGVGVSIPRAVVGVLAVMNGEKPLFNDGPRLRRSASLPRACAPWAPLALGMLGGALKKRAVLQANDLNLLPGVQVLDTAVVIAIAVDEAESLEYTTLIESPAHVLVHEAGHSHTLDG